MYSSTPAIEFNPAISFKLFHRISVTILIMIGSISMLAQKGSPSELQPTLNRSSIEIAQAPDAERQKQLENQREAERVLKEGERLKREVRDNDHGYNDRGLKRQVGEQVNKVRESGSNPQKVREAEAELNRLRQQNNRYPTYYSPYYYPYYTPYYTTPPIIFAPNFSNDPLYNTPVITPRSNSTPNYNSSEPTTPPTQISQTDSAQTPNNSQVSLLVSSGFKDGKIAPGIGLKYNNIGFEIAGIFNQDSLPGTVNDFSLPSNFLFNDLGVKKLSAQWGGDVLGFLDVDPRTSVYGSVGLYFQNVGRIAQSQATNDFYKQTDETNVTGAVGGGVRYKASDNISIGVGYHSLRGVTANMGISF
jgi:opacity protein-like surface antigen